MRRSASPRRSSSRSRACCRGFRSAANSAAPSPFWSSTPASARGFSASWHWATDRDHLGHRLAVRRHADNAADARAAGRLGLADPLCLRHAGRARPGSTSARKLVETPEFLEAEKPADDADQRTAAPPSAAGAAGARHLDHLERLLITSSLYIPTYGVKTLHLPAIDRVHRDPDRRRDPGDRLARSPATGPTRSRATADHAWSRAGCSSSPPIRSSI